MNWFIAGIAFYAGKLLVLLAIALLLFVVAFIFQIPSIIRQLRCKHKRYRENSRCWGVCLDCGAGLGSISKLRERNPGGEQ